LLAKSGEELSQRKEDLDSVFEYRPERATSMARAVLTLGFKETVVSKTDTSEIISLESTNYLGQVALHNGSVIHLLIAHR